MVGGEDNAGFSCDGACFFTLYEQRWPICGMGLEEGKCWFVMEWTYFLSFLFSSPF